jgi:hypothetical protein
VFADNAERSREKAKDVLSAVADLSKNWGEHQDLWDDLGPEDLGGPPTGGDRCPRGGSRPSSIGRELPLARA